VSLDRCRAETRCDLSNHLINYVASSKSAVGFAVELRAKVSAFPLTWDTKWSTNIKLMHPADCVLRRVL
jgi:hypothetical protein